MGVRQILPLQVAHRSVAFHLNRKLSCLILLRCAVKIGVAELVWSHYKVNLYSSQGCTPELQIKKGHCALVPFLWTQETPVARPIQGELGAVANAAQARPT